METTFHEFQHYDFDHDAEFQSGLTRLVIATNSTSSEKLDETTLLKFKWYYYCRRFQPFSLEDYQDWVQRQKLPSTATEASTSDDTPKHPLGFAELCQKILAGEPIPGIREIPEQVSQQPPARSQMTPRKKPWETVPTNNP